MTTTTETDPITDPTTDQSAGTRLGAEDAARVHRLTEEIQGRLEELSALACRAAGIELTPQMTRRFAPAPATSTFGEAPYHHIEIVTTPTDPPQTVVVTYYDDGSVGVQYYQ